MDNTTHHITASPTGASRCVYCKRLASDLGREPTREECSAAPGART